MGFYHQEGIGTYHLNEVKPPRVVPGHERHKWKDKPGWGQSTTCTKCGCIKTIGYTDTYQMPGESPVTERPACKPA